MKLSFENYMASNIVVYCLGLWEGRPNCDRFGNGFQNAASYVVIPQQYLAYCYQENNLQSTCGDPLKCNNP